MRYTLLGKRISTLVVAAFVAVAGIVALLPAKNASAVSCRVFTSVSDFYEAGAVASKIYYVPSSSGCKDINVRNIQNNNLASDNCATFRVQFYPTSGGSYFGSPKFVCSKDPDGSGPQNGSVVPIAINVINGTKYRIWYNVENLGWSHSFQIVD